MKRLTYVFILLTFVLVAFTGCGNNNKLEPQIKHGEFPFKLKYEMNGKLNEINDTVICDFEGFDNTGGLGTIRTWNEQLKSGKDRFTIMSDKNVQSIINPDIVNKSIQVYFDYGDGAYYMSDPETNKKDSSPNFYYIETYESSPTETHVKRTALTKEQLQKYFGVKIIEWTVSKPINNTFK